MTPAEKLAKTKAGRVREKRAGRDVVFLCKVRERREALGLSGHDVAKAVGISHMTLYTVEIGCNPTLSNALALAEFFGVAVTDLWRKIN